MSDKESLTGRYHRITGEAVSIPAHFSAPRIWPVLFGCLMALFGLLVGSVVVLLIRGPRCLGICHLPHQRISAPR